MIIPEEGLKLSGYFRNSCPDSTGITVRFHPEWVSGLARNTHLSSYIIKNKTEYYRLLRDVTVNENWEEWIIYILKGIELVAKETIKKIIQIQKLLENTIDKVKNDLPKIYSKELVEELFVHPYCKIEFLTKILGVERKAASRYLGQLQEIGILKEYKIGREKIFINIELLELLRNSI